MCIEDYFKLFDLDRKYQLDLAELKKNYLAQLVKFHPDRARTPEEKILFLEQSIKFNQAEKILKDDFLRAEYMLKLLGVEFNDKTISNLMTTDDLEKIFEANELIEETDETHALSIIHKQKLVELNELGAQLEKAFNMNNLTKALDLTVRLKYLTNLVKNINLKLKYADN